MKQRNFEAAGLLTMNRNPGCAVTFSGRPGGHGKKDKTALSKARRQEGKRDIRSHL